MDDRDLPKEWLRWLMDYLGRDDVWARRLVG